MLQESIAHSANATLKEVPGTVEEARMRAITVASDTNREVMPVRVFEQGDRTMVSGVLPIRVIVRCTCLQCGPKGSSC